MKKLGTLQHVNIREIWKTEPEFSAWLAKPENITLLGNAIDVDILAEETESNVGRFRVDIYAKEDGTDRQIVIENQYETSDHDHLGKLLTYAAGKDAKILVWVVEEANDEHRAAIEWINEHTDADIGIFLVQIAVYCIGDSPAAPQFTVIERPNEWVKQVKKSGESPGAQRRLDFWTGFDNFTQARPDFVAAFKRCKPSPYHFVQLAVGTSVYHIELNVTLKKFVGAEIYINNNKDVFDHFAEHKEAIEQELGLEMEWRRLPDKNASRIIARKTGDYTKEEQWDELFGWLCEKSIALKKVFAKYVKQDSEVQY